MRLVDNCIRVHFSLERSLWSGLCIFETQMVFVRTDGHVKAFCRSFQGRRTDV